MREPSSTSRVVELRDVSLSFRGVPVLEDVSLDLGERDYLAILGPNGSGKSTLLRVMLGLLEPDRGEVRVCTRVGYVPQRFEFDRDFPIRVADVVLMGRLGARGLLRRFSSDDRDRARATLERLEIAHLAGRQLGVLSGGELQRVLIARALASEPRLLLLDEPDASLDEPFGQRLWELLESLSQKMTVVLVSHDIGAISTYVRTVACLNRRLHLHPSGKLTPEMLEQTYGCPVDLLAHGHPHRVLQPHEDGGDGA